MSSLIRDEQGRSYRLGAAVLDLPGESGRKRPSGKALKSFGPFPTACPKGSGFWTASTKRPIRVNSSLCRMLGYAEEELLSMSVTDIHPPDDAVCTLARIQARADGRFQEDTNVPLLRKDGSVFYADIMGNTLTYGGRPCVLGLFRDITERRQAAEALPRVKRSTATWSKPRIPGT